MDWKAIYAAIKRHAENTVPFECCGIILTDGQVVESENVYEPKEYRSTHYAVDPLLVNRYMADEKIFGFYHSHPDNQRAFVSHADNMDAASYPGKRVVIAAVSNGITRDVQCYIARSDGRGGPIRLWPNLVSDLQEAVDAANAASRV